MINIEVQPETAAKLAMQAQRRGISIDEYLRALLVKSNDEPNATVGYLEAQRKAEAFREWATRRAADTPLLSDESVSRESIYQER